MPAPSTGPWADAEADAEAAEAEAAQLAEAAGDESEAAEEVEISEPESAIETAPAVPGEGQVLLPDLSGQSARQAVRASAELGLLPHISGTGFVIAQTPEAGVPVDVGSEVRLVLAAPAAAVEYAEPEEENLPVQDEPAQQGTP